MCKLAVRECRSVWQSTVERMKVSCMSYSENMTGFTERVAANFARFPGYRVSVAYGWDTNTPELCQRNPNFEMPAVWIGRWLTFLEVHVGTQQLKNNDYSTRIFGLWSSVQSSPLAYTAVSSRHFDVLN